MRNFGTLSKNICVRCNDEYYGILGQWNAYDNEDWKNGFVNCPLEYVISGETKRPPKSCPYQLEHLMETQ